MVSIPLGNQPRLAYEVRLSPMSCHQNQNKACPVHSSAMLGTSLRGRESLVPISLHGGCWHQNVASHPQEAVKSPTLAMTWAQHLPCWWLLPIFSFLAKCSWMRAVFSRAGGMSGLHRDRKQRGSSQSFPRPKPQKQLDRCPAGEGSLLLSREADQVPSSSPGKSLFPLDLCHPPLKSREPPPQKSTELSLSRRSVTPEANAALGPQFWGVLCHRLHALSCFLTSGCTGMQSRKLMV